MTLLELIIACAILMILASAAMPVARYTVQRQKEAELHRDLREMRDAIDRYKDAADQQSDPRGGRHGRLSARPRYAGKGRGYGLAAQRDWHCGSDESGTTHRTVDGCGGNVQRIRRFSDLAAQFWIGTRRLRVQRLERIRQRFRATNSSGNSSNQGQDLVRHVRFLRRIPVDPMTGKADMGHAFGAGRSRCVQLGRQGRVRRFFDVHEHGP